MAEDKRIPLTDGQKITIEQTLAAVESTPVAAFASTANSPHARVFVAAFDGTWNDKLAIPPGENISHVARLEQQLSEHYDDKFTGKYYNGVGTRTNWLNAKLEGALGVGCEERAERAYADFTKTAQAWLKEDPKAEIHVHVMGFSRGAASARHFLNMVDDRGVPAEHLTKQEGPWSYAVPPGGVSSSALLFDTVATGQSNTLKLEIPKSTQFVAHFVSLDERRYTFPLTSTKGGAPEAGPDLRNRAYEFPGAHSDIGGTYGGGVRDVTSYAADVISNKLGLPIPTPSMDKGTIDSAYLHDSRWDATKMIEAIVGEHKTRTSIDVPEEAHPLATVPPLFQSLRGNIAHESLSELPPELRDATLVRTSVYSIDLDLRNDGSIEWSTTHPSLINYNSVGQQWEFKGAPVLKLDSYLVDMLKEEGHRTIDVQSIQPLSREIPQMCFAPNAPEQYNPHPATLDDALKNPQWLGLDLNMQLKLMDAANTYNGRGAQCEAGAMQGERHAAAQPATPALEME